MGTCQWALADGHFPMGTSQQPNPSGQSQQDEQSDGSQWGTHMANPVGNPKGNLNGQCPIILGVICTPVAALPRVLPKRPEPMLVAVRANVFLRKSGMVLVSALPSVRLIKSARASVDVMARVCRKKSGSVLVAVRPRVCFRKSGSMPVVLLPRVLPKEVEAEAWGRRLTGGVASIGVGLRPPLACGGRLNNGGPSASTAAAAAGLFVPPFRLGCLHAAVHPSHV